MMPDNESEPLCSRSIHPLLHPVGTRMIVAPASGRGDRELQECTIVEYSPRLTAVKVKIYGPTWYRLHPNPYWEVVEVLPPIVEEHYDDLVPSVSEG